jgi:hypothetical protein
VLAGVGEEVDEHVLGAGQEEHSKSLSGFPARWQVEGDWQGEPGAAIEQSVDVGAAGV